MTPLAAPEAAQAAAPAGPARWGRRARLTFVRPHRPPGARLFNAAGRALWRAGLGRPLDGDRILRKACRATGLDDWGGVELHEPLGRLVSSLNAEAGLNSLGRLMIRKMLAHHAMNTLLVQEYARRHPEVRDIRIRQPVFIAGLPRTGTTLLQNLLGRDPRLRPLRTWESIWPVPPGSSGRPGAEQRIRMTRRLLRMIRILAPDLETAHPIDAEGLEECTWLTRNGFVSGGFLITTRMPAYLDWLEGLDEEQLARGYAHFRLQLQVLTHQRPGWRWVLKSPVHLAALAGLFRVFPDAVVIQTHRDPLRVLPSCCSLFALMRGVFSDEVDLPELGREVSAATRLSLQRAAAVRQRHTERMLDVQYQELVHDKLGTVRRLYDRIGLPFDAAVERGMRQWLDSQQHRGGHEYRLEQFGLDAESVNLQFADYRREYHIPVEQPR